MTYCPASMQEPALQIDPTTQMSDNALLAAFAKGHADAARLLSERLLPKAYAQAFFRLRNQADAEDIAQEAFIRLWRMAPNLSLIHI